VEPKVKSGEGEELFQSWTDQRNLELSIMVDKKSEGGRNRTNLVCK